MSSVRWEEPSSVVPTRRGQPRVWFDRVEPIMTKPGEWAMIHRARDAAQANNAVRSLRSRKVIYPEGRFEFTNEGRRVFARYVGGDNANG